MFKVKEYFLVLALVAIWVSNTTQQGITLCKDELDLVLMVDASNSVYDNNFRTQMNSLAALTQRLDVSNSAIRVGVIVFSSTVSSSAISGNKQQVLNNINRFEYLDESTRTDLGLLEAIRLFAQAPRPLTVPKQLMIITDGASSLPSQTLQAARQAKAAGINIYAIGISDAINRVELQQLASSPTQVMLTPDFNNISKVLNDAVNQACTYITVATRPPTTPRLIPNHLCYRSGSINSGIGYVSHPWECDKYIQCYYNAANGFHLGVVRHCPLGLFYNSRTTNCDWPSNVTCPYDFCRTGCASYPMADTFRGYWTCKNQMSVGMCCDDMETFVKGKGCVKDNTKCYEPCELGECGKGKCLSRPVWNTDTSYMYRMDHIGRSLWFPGVCQYNRHDIVNCACTASRDHFCTPDFETNFNTVTSLGQYMKSTGVTFGSNGASVGPGRYLHLDLHKGMGNEPFTLTMLYRDVVTTNSIVPVLMRSSHNCPINGGMLSVTSSSETVKAVIKSKNGQFAYASVSLKGLNTNNLVKELTLSYSGKELVLSIKVGTVQFVEKTKAPYGITFPCGIDIGPTPSTTGFTGTLQRLSLYSCTPAKLY